MLESADDGYNQTRQIWNASVNKHPRLIAQCSGVADVIAAINFGRENELLAAIRGGGHNVGGRALCDDGLVIDLSRMRSVHVDAVNQTVRVQSGATLGNLDRETHVFGLAVPSGIVPKTGIAGLTLGGGVGWLLRKYGMSIDNLCLVRWSRPVGPCSPQATPPKMRICFGHAIPSLLPRCRILWRRRRPGAQGCYGIPAP